MPGKVIVVGLGIAGLSCAKLLASFGYKVTIHGSISANMPVLVLNNMTCNLLLDIWHAERDLFEGSYVVNQRKIRWGNKTLSVINQPSVVIKGDLLIRRLYERLIKIGDQISIEQSTSDSDISQLMALILSDHNEQIIDWLIDASGRSSKFGKKLGIYRRRSFGNRCIISNMVMLDHDDDQNTCWMESIPDGWIFAAPLERNRAVLQVMVTNTPKDSSIMLKNLLEQTETIKTLVTGTIGSTSVLEAFPQISDPLCGPQWIAIGDSAISFDPLSGDGTGYAIKGAILAAGIIDGVASKLPLLDCLNHYTLRLRTAFLSHLKECLKYYSIPFSSSSDWKEEIQLMKNAFSEISLNNVHFKFGLNGYKLVRLKE